MAIPKLKTNDIRSHFHETYFARGRAYYQDGMIFDAIKRGSALEAKSYGSQGNQYRLIITFEGKAIQKMSCSCPVGIGCKHLAALLIYWSEHPEDFVERQEVHEQLRKRTKDELIDLIERMIKRDPSLEDLLDLPKPKRPSAKQLTKKERAAINRQVRKAFEGFDYEYGTAHDSDLLSELLGTAEELIDAEDWEQAAYVYQSILQEALFQYENGIHDDYNLIEDVHYTAKGLMECITGMPMNSDQRKDAVDGIYRLMEQDLALGGYGLSDGIPELFFPILTPAERTELQQAIEGELSSEENTADFHRNYWGSWYALLLQHDYDEATVVAELERWELYPTLYNFLLERGRTEVALSLAQSRDILSDHQWIVLANRLDEEGEGERALYILESRAKEKASLSLLESLLQRYSDQKAYDQAYQVQLQLWEKSPTLDRYTDLNRLAKRLPALDWEKVRESLLANLRRRPYGGESVLVDIHLFEKEWKAAWSIAEQHSSRSSYLREEVARHTEKHLPERTRAYYLDRARWLIQQRGRNNYQIAIDYLDRARPLFARTGDHDDWQQAVELIQVENYTLRALQDELRRAPWRK